jgi:hypothetical protein
MLTEVTGLVLKSVNLGEADRLITVFTKEMGTVSALVKGARSIKSKKMSSTLQFCYSAMILESKGDKLWVKEANLIESFFGLRNTIEGLSLAGYIVEVLSFVTVAEAENVILAAAGKLLRGVKLFDVYRGTGVPQGMKSLAFSLSLRADDRTLTDADSEAVVNKVLAALKEKLGATLR